MATTRPRPWIQSWSARQVHHLDGSRRAPPPERSEARRIAKMAKSFTHIDGELYKRATSGVLQ
jgi:hypothetical protein